MKTAVIVIPEQFADRAYSLLALGTSPPTHWPASTAYNGKNYHQQALNMRKFLTISAYEW